MKAVPKAFQIPKEKDELLAYAKANPSTMFVQKNSNHRGIKIEKVESLDLNQNNSFVQVSIESVSIQERYFTFVILLILV